MEQGVGPSASSTGDGVGFVSMGEEIPAERCARARGEVWSAPRSLLKAGGFGRKTAHLCNS